MPKISKFLRIFLPLTLVLIAVLLCVRNYTPGTYLLGWDSIHPEFNFSLNVKRLLSHVWGSEMGVGAISAHSDMGDLSRYLILWLTSVVLPVSFIRYFYIFSCLILGPLGMYFFLKYVFEKDKDTPWVFVASFLGGLFYLLNLGTLQNFYVPLEMFTVAFAGFPWIALFGLRYLREGKRRNLVMFSITSILIAPMAYAATQAYAVYLGLFLFLAGFLVFSGAKKLKVKRLLILAVTTLALNIYWIAPNVYAIVQQPLTISNANINRLFSQESFLRNADYGNPANVLIQKSFLFSWRNWDTSAGAFKDLLNIWRAYLANPAVSITGYFLAILSIAGIITGIFKKEKVSLSLLLPLLLCLFFLFNINPPFGNIYGYLYSHFRIFSEGFRTPFTKFSVLFEFILAFYFGYLSFVVLSARSKYLSEAKVLATLLLTAGLIYFSLPAFKGELIGKNVRVDLPGEYSQLFDWFKNKEGRIALMPINSKFGWEYRNWGYEGSEFLTYGIANPIFYRDFDRWNAFNEDFYNQSAFALYANDNQGFFKTLQKYQVKYVLIDGSIINAGGSDGILKIKEITDILEKNGSIKVAEFGFLSVYDTGISSESVTTPQSYSTIEADLTYSPQDLFYREVGDYIGDGKVDYPFINLDKRSGVKIGIENGLIKFTNAAVNASLTLPVTNIIKTDLTVNQGFDKAFNCDLKKVGKVSKEIDTSGVTYKASRGGASCDYASFPILKYSEGYILKITGQNISGRSLKIYLFDSLSQNPVMEEILPPGHFNETYFIYPRNVAGAGYILNFETRSFGRIPSENILTGVEFYSFDYGLLNTLKGTTLQGVHSVENNLQVKFVKKYGNWGYKVDTFGQGLLQLGQGYEKGWVGVGVGQSWSELVAGKTNSFTDKLRLISTNFNLLQHVKVNSWANGWIVGQSQSQLVPADAGLVKVGSNGEADQLQPVSTIYLFFWPQMLEWGGLLTGVITILVILVKVRKS